MHKTENPESTKAFLRDLYERALASALPKNAMRDLEWPEVSGRTCILSVGKAATQMYAAIQNRLPKDAEGIIVTPRGYAQPGFAPQYMQIIEASHPVPDAAGTYAAHR